MNKQAKEWAADIAATAGVVAKQVLEVSPSMSTEFVETLRHYIETQAMLAMHEFARRVAAHVRAQTFDETPTNINTDPLAMARDAGYRAGHNDRARSIAKLLDEPPQPNGGRHASR